MGIQHWPKRLGRTDCPICLQHSESCSAMPSGSPSKYNAFGSSIWLNVFRMSPGQIPCFCHPTSHCPEQEWILWILSISRQKEAWSRGYALLLFRMTSRVLYSAQYHRQYCPLHSFEQFRALYIHNHDDKYPARPGFEPGTSRLQAPVDMNQQSERGQEQQETRIINTMLV